MTPEPEILIRSYALERTATTGDDGRTLEIRAVPWDVEIPIGPDVVESFDRRAFDGQLRAANRVKLTLGHPKPGDLLTNSLIGSLSSMEVRDDGLHTRARMATSTAASEALALVNDGVLDQVSIGFVDVRTDRSRRGATTVLRRTAARLHHLALVPDGAYGDGAKILAVREVGGPTLADLRLTLARLKVV